MLSATTAKHGVPRTFRKQPGLGEVGTGGRRDLAADTSGHLRPDQCTLVDLLQILIVEIQRRFFPVFNFLRFGFLSTTNESTQSTNLN